MVRACDLVCDRVRDVVAWRGEAVAAEKEDVFFAIFTEVRRLDERAVAVVAIEDLDRIADGRDSIGAHLLKHDGSRLDWGLHVVAEAAVAGFVAVDFVDGPLLVHVWVLEAGHVDGAALVQMAGDRRG